jgi:membrane protease YdiL (CAAX protease family)
VGGLFLFGQLYKRAGWRFWPAVLLPAIVFALGPFNQSQDPIETAGVLAVTALGALRFCYIFVQWGGNLWAPFAVHALLNICWFLFDVSDTALGGFYANGLRLLTVVLAMLFCFFAPRFGWLTPLRRGGPDRREAAP